MLRQIDRDHAPRKLAIDSSFSGNRDLLTPDCEKSSHGCAGGNIVSEQLRDAVGRYLDLPALLAAAIITDRHDCHGTAFVGGTVRIDLQVVVPAP